MYKIALNPSIRIANHEHNHNVDTDIEMIALHNINYTSLKDLMPESPPSTASPTFCREIPIKDPLLQHAAWAYLQPMTADRESEDHRYWRRFHQKLCWLLGCFNDVVLVALEGWCPDQLRERLIIRFSFNDRVEEGRSRKC